MIHPAALPVSAAAPTDIQPRLLARSNVTVRQLRAFVAVADVKSFTAAGRQVHVTQSALSALIRELESELGARLFDRTTRSVAATAAGLDFLPTAKRILRELDAGLENVRDLNLKRRGLINVAATPMLAMSLIPSICAGMRHSFPDVRIAVRDRLASDNLASLRSGDADLAIGTFGPLDGGIELRPLVHDRLGVVVSRSHRFGGLRSLTWAELEGEHLITLTRESSYRLLVEQSILRAGLVYEPAFEVAYLGTAIALAQSGLGLAVCPSDAGRTVDRRRARFIPLTAPVVVAQVSLATLSGRSLSPAAQAFVSIAVEITTRPRDS